MNNLRKFTSETDYNTAKDNFDWATISYIDTTNVKEIRWMDEETIYRHNPLTMIANSNTTVTFTFAKNLTVSDMAKIQYSIDNGNWQEINNANNSSPSKTINLTKGQRIKWKGVCPARRTSSSNATSPNATYCSQFSGCTNVTVEGNIMSLLYGGENETWNDKTTLTSAKTFFGLFANSNIINAANLILPATTLTNGCYMSMFWSCGELKVAPKILPAMELVQNCYNDMFSSCNNLIIPPQLPAKTLASRCYNHMFANCISLTYAPILPALYLAEYCYGDMFWGCYNISSIQMMAIDISPTACLSAWTYGVRLSGTFIKSRRAKWEVYGPNGIPAGWMVLTQIDVEKSDIYVHEHQ